MSNELETKLVEISNETLKIVDQNNKFVIRGEKSLTETSEFLVSVKQRIKRVEELRKWFVKPLNDQVKAINVKFKEASQPLEQVESLVGGKIVEYRKKEAEIIEQKRLADEKRQKDEFDAEQKRLAKEAKELKGQEKKDAIAEIPKEFIPEVETKQKTVIKTDSGSLKTRKLWKAKIVDEMIVPREFLSVDMVKINKAIRSGQREIKGLDIYQEETLI